MRLIFKLRQSKYQILITVVPITIIVMLGKMLFHYLGWEIMPRELTSFFPSILTGIIFLLGFLLAGVVADYKESEKIPNEIVTSLYIIKQEADMLIFKDNNCQKARDIIEKIKIFISMLKTDFFIDKNKNIFALVDSLSLDFAALDSILAPNYMARLKAEQANLKKILNRINIIKNTDFAPSLLATIKVIISFFIIIYFFLDLRPLWSSMLLVWFFTLVLFSIVYLIEDMEDPFDYDHNGAKSDEISLAVLDDFYAEITAALKY